MSLRVRESHSSGIEETFSVLFRRRYKGFEKIELEVAGTKFVIRDEDFNPENSRRVIHAHIELEPVFSKLESIPLGKS